MPTPLEASSTAAPAVASFADYLAAVRRHLPPAAISADGIAAMMRVAELLPSRLGHNAFGFEVPLADGTRDADLLLAVDPAASDLGDTLAEIPAGLRRQPAWTALARLRRQLARPEARGELANLWLEFDTRGPAPLLPSVFFMPMAPIRRARQDHPRACEITRETLKLVARQRPLALDSGILERCFDALPPAASLFQIGVMNARPNRLLRICAALHNPRTLLAYLQAIGYPAELTAVERHIRWLRRYSDRLRLNLDLALGVRPELGIECYVHGPRPGKRWAALLSTLSRAGCAGSAKSRALLSYPGSDSPQGEPSTWPPGLRQAAGWLSGHAVLERRRTLHHVKVVFEPGEPLAAKAYLGVEHLWRPGVGRRSLETPTPSGRISH